MTLAEIAEPYLKLTDTERVFVSEKGTVWVNNSEDEMQKYFESKNEKYQVFTPKKKKINGA
jgi:hypothetical protein